MRTIPQLLALEGYDKLPLRDRWNVIDEIDQQIDHLQHCQRVLIQHNMSYASLEEEIRQLRTKRVLVWLSFNTRVATAIRLAA
ncbi:hypothetical protein [uncultured Spirosoma sp.]|uniref:hypothetical protein n=1 Tax=uncultured Spirosoma sp. TaxID=278208 RepID=UPI002583EE8C|nr:hypothetical protein [uncultured Spirosoma sp.]